MPARRAYGMDQDFYPWSPIVTRPVLRWPDDARVALAVIVNLEHWDWEVPAGEPLAISPMSGPEGLWRRESAAIPRYWRLRQPRIRQPGRCLSCPRGARQIWHHANLGAGPGGGRPLSDAGWRRVEARRRVHRARAVAPPPHPALNSSIIPLLKFVAKRTLLPSTLAIVSPYTPRRSRNSPRR